MAHFGPQFMRDAKRHRGRRKANYRNINMEPCLSIIGLHRTNRFAKLHRPAWREVESLGCARISSTMIGSWFLLPFELLGELSSNSNDVNQNERVLSAEYISMYMTLFQIDSHQFSLCVEGKSEMYPTLIAFICEKKIWFIYSSIRITGKIIIRVNKQWKIKETELQVSIINKLTIKRFVEFN